MTDYTDYDNPQREHRTTYQRARVDALIQRIRAEQSIFRCHKETAHDVLARQVNEEMVLLADEIGRLRAALDRVKDAIDKAE